MKKYIKSFLLLVTIMLTHTVFAGAHTPGYISVISDPYNSNLRTLEVTMNFKHNPATQQMAYFEIRRFPNFSIVGADGLTGNLECHFNQSSAPQLYADAMLMLNNLPASSKLRVVGINNGECLNFSLSNSSVYGEEKVVRTLQQ